MNLNQVTIPRKNIEKSIQFYQTLGLKLIVHSHDHYARFECPDGDSTFSFHHTENLPKGEGVFVYFENEDLDNQVSLLKAAGLMFEQMPTDQPWLWREARLKDPDGNQIILFKAGESRKNPPWRLK